MFRRSLFIFLRLACLSSAQLAAAQSGTPPAAPSSDEADDEVRPSAQEPKDIEWLIASADVGYRALDLQKIEYDDVEGSRGKLIPAAANGFSPGIGLGMRLWFVSLMLHADVTFLSDSGAVLDDDLELWNLDLEGAFRMMQGRFQPYLLLGFGYSALGGISDVIDNVRNAADAHGVNARLGVGFDYYLNRIFTLGFRAHADGLLLASRVSAFDLAQPEEVDTLGETKARLREADGSIAGFCYAAGITFAAHYL